MPTGSYHSQLVFMPSADMPHLVAASQISAIKPMVMTFGTFNEIMDLLPPFKTQKAATAKPDVANLRGGVVRSIGRQWVRIACIKLGRQ